MAKRHGDSAHGFDVRIKKRKGVKVRTVRILDSDDENHTLNFDADYARLVKTRATTSGKAESTTMSSLPLFEVKETAHDDDPLDQTLNDREEISTENTILSVPAKRRRKKKNDSVRSSPSTKLPSMLTAPQTKMRTFLDVRSTILDDMITLDGPGNSKLNLCNSCKSVQAAPIYRCLECSYSLLYCRECIVKSHAALPLHRLEVRSLF